MFKLYIAQVHILTDHLHLAYQTLPKTVSDNQIYINFLELHTY